MSSSRRTPRQLILLGLVALALIAVVVWNQSGPPRGFVSRTQLGAQWPLIIESGTLRCLPGTLIVLDAPDGNTYAVNGTARGAKTSAGADRWYDVQQLAVPRASTQPLIDRGLQLC